MMHRSSIRNQNQAVNAPGFIGYLTVVLWFLLTVLSSGPARADDIVNSRQPITLRASDILPQIEAALIDKGMNGGAEVVLNSPDLTFSTSSDVAVAFTSYNERSGRFVIRLQGVSTPVAGFVRVTEVFPVLTRAINRGDIIGEHDITFVESNDKRAGYFIQDAADIIGMEARRPLSAQTPLRSSDVAAPVLVKKGALVTITYVTEGLRLSHQGVALATGSRGDVISIRNIQSERTVKAIISGENIAKIATPRTQLLKQES